MICSHLSYISIKLTRAIQIFFVWFGRGAVFVLPISLTCFPPHCCLGTNGDGHDKSINQLTMWWTHFLHLFTAALLEICRTEWNYEALCETADDRRCLPSWKAAETFMWLETAERSSSVKIKAWSRQRLNANISRLICLQQKTISMLSKYKNCYDFFLQCSAVAHYLLLISINLKCRKVFWDCWLLHSHFALSQ